MTTVSAVRPARRRRLGSSGPRRVVGQRWWTPYLFMLPGLFFFATMFAWPAVLAVQLAFARYSVASPPEFVGLANFATLLEDPRFHIALRNSFVFLIMFLPLCVVAPLFMAILVNQKLRGIQVFRVAYYLPVITSMVAVAIAWRFVMSRDGVINWLLSLIGVGPIGFLLDSHWALPSVVIIEAWKSLGLYMMLYLAGLQSVQPELLEAAKMDGASWLRRLWHVIVPAILPFVAVTLTLAMLDAMRSFESIYMLTRGGPQDSTLTLGYYIWHVAFERYDMGYASAVGLVLWAIMIILALLNQLVTRKQD
ncbi:carbohydrate ABC transporter permease [Propionibacteriaceae bacterium Y1685]|uniref:carbohydrate ABC transporter permease n=1 Tax=Microlunatus sp. Y1700 TaxID=3418487 RepID=UPI003B7D2D1C